MMNTKHPMHSFCTKTGLMVCVRRLQADDARFMIDIFDHMGPESRYQRFGRTIGDVSRERVWQEAQEMTRLLADGKSNGVIAFCALPGKGIQPLGAARYVRTTSREAEVSVSVRDDFQGMGIGTHLVRLLVEIARENGIERLVGDTMTDNAPMLYIFERLPYTIQRIPEGNYHKIIIDLTSPHAPFEIEEDLPRLVMA